MATEEELRKKLVAATGMSEFWVKQLLQKGEEPKNIALSKIWRETIEQHKQVESK